MPAIARHSAKFAPAFYWHLGDLRAIYKIDEDMAFAAQNRGEVLTCDNYQRRAWSDFVENQIAAFGDMPFYVGIGNHEVIPPKNEEAFKRHFFDWLSLPRLQSQRQLDREPPLPEAYFHWIQGGVDFIYLDNASNFFSDDQQTWLIRRLQSATSNPEVKSVVVGMHEALPDSIANYHSMGDNATEPRARPSGENIYKALLAFRDKSQKPVYVLATPLPFLYGRYLRYAQDEGKRRQAPPRLDCRYRWSGALSAARWRPAHGEDGHLRIPAGARFHPRDDPVSFEEVRESDVPQHVQQRYPADCGAVVLRPQFDEPGAYGGRHHAAVRDCRR